MLIREWDLSAEQGSGSSWMLVGLGALQKGLEEAGEELRCWGGQAEEFGCGRGF